MRQMDVVKQCEPTGRTGVTIRKADGDGYPMDTYISFDSDNKNGGKNMEKQKWSCGIQIRNDPSQCNFEYALGIISGVIAAIEEENEPEIEKNDQTDDQYMVWITTTQEKFEKIQQILDSFDFYGRIVMDALAYYPVEEVENNG